MKGGEGQTGTGQLSPHKRLQPHAGTRQLSPRTRLQPTWEQDNSARVHDFNPCGGTGQLSPRTRIEPNQETDCCAPYLSIVDVVSVVLKLLPAALSHIDLYRSINPSAKA